MAPRAVARPWRVERFDGGVHVSGQLRTVDAEALVSAVREATSGIGAPQIDLAGVEQMDGGVIALLRADLARRGVPAELRGAARFRPLIDLYGEGRPPPPRRPRAHEGVLAQVGRAAVEDVEAIESSLGFVGHMTVAAGRLVRRPRHARLRELVPLVSRSGADALPIVLVIDFLLGLVVAYMSARELKMFAANIYVADLVGIATARQLAPLMTAIIVTGRSGAAFATELGSMRISEEIDALRALGLEPFGWLVLPRVVTLVLVLPVLTAVGDVVGMLGGLVIATSSLDLSRQQYVRELRLALVPFDVWSGLLMSVAFAVAIGLIACAQGFAASGGPQGVGQRTTTTVVSSIFALVVIDAIFTVLFRLLGYA
jgi:phospholipid/cholesterol/gamma-HCH transport system permease protein